MTQIEYGDNRPIFSRNLGLVQFSKHSVAELYIYIYHKIFFSMVVSFGHPKIDVKS